MPGRDGTGPMGFGPMTGRGAGLCAGLYAGYAALRYISPRLGCGLGFGRGSGYRRMAYCAGTPEWGSEAYNGYNSPADEREYLNKETELVKNHLQQLEKRLKELDGDSDK